MDVSLERGGAEVVALEDWAITECLVGEVEGPGVGLEEALR